MQNNDQGKESTSDTGSEVRRDLHRDLVRRDPKNIPTHSLVAKLISACAKVKPVPKRGRNAKYDYHRATDIAEAFRKHLFRSGIIIIAHEGTPEYAHIQTSNGGEQITECRLPVVFEITDGRASITAAQNGVGRDVEDKALFKAKTGALKYLIKELALIPDKEDDPEFERASEHGEAPHDAAQEMRAASAPYPQSEKPVTRNQIRAFNDACRSTGKSQDEVSGYLLTTHHVSKLADLPRGRPFTEALRWAASGAPTIGLVPPKSQPAPAMQPTLPLPAPPSELKIGNQRIEIPARKDSFAL